MSKNLDLTSESKFFSIIKAGMKMPGTKINREDFLRKELSHYFEESIVIEAIKNNPAKAGITVSQIDKIAKSCINNETYKVTTISTVAGMPGGFALIGTVPADTAQYFAHIIRILQKLIYLYGWQEIYNSDGDFDDETMNILVLFIGIMFGVSVASKIVLELSGKVALNVQKAIVNKALTKGVVYPIVKKVASILGVKVTKDVFAKTIGKAVPIIGGGISGALTYVTFKPSAIRLEKHLKSLPTADVNFYRKDNYENHSEVIDIELE